MPSSESVSHDEPVPTRIPIVTDNSPSICFTTSRSPLPYFFS